MTPQQWEVEARRNLMVENTRKKIQDEADAALKKEMEGKKAEVDTKLKEGKKFADLAKEYSDDDRKAEGGEMGWIGAGLLQKDAEYYEAQRKALFDTPVGQISEWVDIPAGFVRYEVYDRKKAEGPDFEKEKPNLIEQIKKEHPEDANYTPTDEEIKERYDQVAARQIMLRTSAPDKFGEEINKLKDSAKYEFNNLYVLANQALNEAKLQPPAEATPEQLEEIAKRAAIGTGYDFQLIKDKRQAGQAETEPGLLKPEGAETEDADAAAETDTAAEDAAAETAAAEGETAAEGDSAAADDAAADAEAEAAAKVDIPQADISADAGSAPTPEVYNLADTPVYALAIGLLEMAAQSEGATSSSLPHYLIAKTYNEWLEDEEMLKLQPIEREKARELMETALAQVVEKDNYNADAYAMRGLNLAWQDKKEESYKQLDLAIKYARQEEGPTWEMIQKAYEVFDDQAKIDMVADKLAEFRQKQLQEMIEQAQARQENAAPVMPDGTPIPGADGAPVEIPPATPPPAGDVPPVEGGQ
ncbi:peptidylprolyl isomerase [bacterium]|nr:peptidylprolyl isomerase [bacterium]